MLVMRPGFLLRMWGRNFLRGAVQGTEGPCPCRPRSLARGGSGVAGGGGGHGMLTQTTEQGFLEEHTWSEVKGSTGRAWLPRVPPLCARSPSPAEPHGVIS